MYGIVISIGAVSALFLAEFLAKQKKMNPEIVWDLGTVSLIGGIIGARIYHVIDLHTYYFSDPLQIIMLQKGGLGIFGGIIGGLIGTILYLRLKKENVLKWVDLAAVVLPLAQAVGRWGNYFNNELFGKPTDLPFGLFVSEENRPDNLIEFKYFHPLFFYESLANIIIFWLLFRLYSKKHAKYNYGLFTGLYLIFYGVVRFLLEFLRNNPWAIYGVNVAQMIAVVFVLGGLVILEKKSPGK